MCIAMDFCHLNRPKGSNVGVLKAQEKDSPLRLPRLYLGQTLHLIHLDWLQSSDFPLGEYGSLLLVLYISFSS